VIILPVLRYCATKEYLGIGSVKENKRIKLLNEPLRVPPPPPISHLKPS
jgi:hypothetical protein